MTNSRFFIWQYKVPITIFLTGFAFIVGISLPIQRWQSPTTEPSPSKPTILTITDLIAQQNQIYQKRLNELAKEKVKEKAKHLTISVPIQFQGKTIRQVQLKSSRKVIALTFDDGPWESTTVQVLDILKQNHIEATFFVVGKNVKNHPELLKKIVADGHAVGNHSWSHHYYHYNVSTAANELNKTVTLIHKLTGVKTLLFRPPGGILNNGLVTYARQQKYAVITWSVDSKDWDFHHTTVPKLMDNVLKEAKPGGIVLLHDGGGDRSTTIEALPELIAKLKEQGYQFVTVPELLEMAAKENTKHLPVKR